MLRRMLAVTAATVFVSCAAQAGPLPELQGFWGGGLKGRGTLQVEARVIEDHAKINLNMSYWGPDRQRMRCEYYTKLDGGGAGPAYLNSGNSDGACPTTGRFSFKRLSPARLEIRTPSFGGHGQFKLSESIRPLRPAEIGALPERFKILGLSIGTARSAMEKALNGKGYQQAKITPYQGRDNEWRAEMVEYSPGGLENAADRVTVVYSLTEPPSPRGEPIALLLHRHVTLPEDKPLQAGDLRAAMKNTFGQPSIGRDSGTSMDFKYLSDGLGRVLQGRNSERVWCRKGTRQQISLGYYPREWRNGSSLRSHCGSQLSFFASIDRRLGTVRSYTQSLSSVDLATTNFWRRLAAENIKEFQTFVKTRENSSTGAIKL